MQAEHILIRPIRPEDDAPLSRIIRSNLEQFHLNIPGTAYFDPELDHLSRYYRAAPDRRAYFVAVDEAGRVLGGVGLAEFSGFSHCAELQKLYWAGAGQPPDAAGPELRPRPRLWADVSGNPLQFAGRHPAV